MDYVIRKGEVISVTKAGAAPAPKVMGGRVWLTRPDDSRDYILKQGDRFPAGGNGSFILEALEDAVITLEGIPLQESSITIRVNCVLLRHHLAEAR